MRDPIQEAQRAETWQSLKALLIPLSLFLACLITAAGTFLIRNGESVGWMFLAVALLAIIMAFVGLIRFQNKLRVKGAIPPGASDGVSFEEPATTTTNMSKVD
jgi:hypothetical protein